MQTGKYKPPKRERKVERNKTKKETDRWIETHTGIQVKGKKEEKKRAEEREKEQKG